MASSTVGVAATGLALGKAESSTSSRPSSKKRKATDLVDVENQEQYASPPPSRPGTGSTMITPNNKPIPHKTGSSSGSYPPQAFYNRPSNAKLDSLFSSGGRRSSVVRTDEALSPVESTFEGSRRDSVSSRGSWIKRLSTIPISSANSPRSSIGPDTPSQTLSHSSGTPILADAASTPAPLKPNKLVRRAPSGRAVSGEYTRSGSKSQVPTLRRPATSHQRSATLQQRFREDATPKEQLQRTPSLQAMQTTTESKLNSPESQGVWRPFFDSRPRKVMKERTSGRPSIGNTQHSYTYAKRVLPEESVKATLVKPYLITISQRMDGQHYDEDSLPIDGVQDSGGNMGGAVTDTEEPAQDTKKRARRSFSMNFSTPTSWASRSGSLRGKRPVETKDAQKRYSSAPVSTLPGRQISTSHGATKTGHRNITDPTVFQKQSPSEQTESPSDPFISAGFKPRSRNSSSPLPPLSRLSSFNFDLSRLGLSSTSPSTTSPSIPQPLQKSSTQCDNTTSPLLPTAQFTTPYNSIRVKSLTSEITDRASTLIDSDTDMKGFVSGEDDELDFQSDTVYDSLRSGATGSVRSRNAPLDAMFDESPPSLNGHAKSKRVSVHELMNNGAFREGNKIVEEDEGMSTPVRSARASQEEHLQTPVRKIIQVDIDAIRPSPPNFSLATNDFGRLSLDAEEDDEDWTKDDENDINNQLSPPNSSLSSRRVSPAFRAALDDVTHSGSVNGHTNGERPKSNLFDWSEPPIEKADSSGNTSRPKTAQQNGDGRGGRTSGRKGPTAMHIRSQSVPVVPDVASQREAAKLAPKFGTWGLGAKGVSEDWDNDFEFDGDDAGDVKSPEADLLMRVPPAIQASQATVVGHVGQIREVCLLVEDLKRLRNLAREKDLLNGSTATLWKEAEGIIALAVPDEEDLALSPPRSPSSSFFDHDDHEYKDDRYIDHGPDVTEVGIASDGYGARRQSVFSPEDNIFGAGSEISNPPVRENLRPPQLTPRHSSAKSSDVARSVMETMHQHRSTSDPLLSELTNRSVDKMPFDTTSLRDLVHRASMLSRTLADIVRKSEGITTSPDCSPRRQSNPAFTRVFTDPMAKAGPQKHLPRSHSNNSVLSSPMDVSPSRSLGQHMHMMAVV